MCQQEGREGTAFLSDSKKREAVFTYLSNIGG